MAVFKDVVIKTVYARADGEFHFPPRIARKSDAETATYTASESRRAAVMVLIAPVTAESDVIECHSEVGADEKSGIGNSGPITHLGHYRKRTELGIACEIIKSGIIYRQIGRPVWGDIYLRSRICP